MNSPQEMRRRSLFALVALLAVPVAATTAVSPAPAATAPASASVRIKDIEFDRTRVTIRRGGFVRWTFLDGRTSHNVRSTGSPRFPGSATKQTGTYRVTFKRAGTYRYVCTLHLNMKGTVVVR
jgi:plastocyanin